MTKERYGELPDDPFERRVQIAAWWVGYLGVKLLSALAIISVGVILWLAAGNRF